MGLTEAIGEGPVALDTSVFIYYFEEHALFLPLVEPVFRKIDAGDVRGVTSMLTLLEVLVVPYRSGLLELAERYEAILLSSRNLEVVPLDPPLLRAAAQLRAATSMRTPDALQVAAALALGCSKLLTNDRRLPTVPGLEVLQLSDFL